MTLNDMSLADEGRYMEEITDRVSGMVHEETQTEGRGLDLTLSAVYRVDDPGQVDFGGGELDNPGLNEEVAEQREADDDYGWWTLDAGTYLVAYNESLTTDDSLLLQTREEVLTRGGYHPTLRVTKLDRLPFTVGGSIQFKENARISTLYEDSP